MRGDVANELLDLGLGRWRCAASAFGVDERAELAQ
jgi:hypothetical protein